MAAIMGPNGPFGTPLGRSEDCDLRGSVADSALGDEGVLDHENRDTRHHHIDRRRERHADRRTGVGAVFWHDCPAGGGTAKDDCDAVEGHHQQGLEAPGVTDPLERPGDRDHRARGLGESSTAAEIHGSRRVVLAESHARPADQARSFDAASRCSSEPCR